MTYKDALWTVERLDDHRLVAHVQPVRHGLCIRHWRCWAWGRLFTLALALVAMAGLLWSCTWPVLA